MSYSEHWRREFLARHPGYETQVQVLEQEVTEPVASVSFIFPLPAFIKANCESSAQLSQQESKRQHLSMQNHAMSSEIIRRVCCLRQQLKLTQQELSKQLGISSRTLQDWEQGRRQPRGPGRALLLQWVDRQSAHSC